MAPCNFRWDQLDDGQVVNQQLDLIRQVDLNANSLKSNIPHLANLSRSAFLMGRLGCLRPDDRLLRRIKKFGSYYRAVWEIINQLNNPQYLQFRANLYFTEIPTYTPVSHEIVSNPLLLMNQNASRFGYDQVSEESFIEQFFNYDKSGNLTKVTISCHCELNIVLHVAWFSPSPANVEIGISKGLCWLCEQYVKHFSDQANIRILVSQYQGKVHAGWMLPPRSPDYMKQKMRTVIDQEINELREQII